MATVERLKTAGPDSGWRHPVALAQRWPVERLIAESRCRCDPSPPSPHPDCRRSARRPRSAAAAAQGRRATKSSRPDRPAAILEAIDGDEFDAVLMDLNYARDTTSGQEGLDLLSQLRAPRSDAAGGGDDRVGQRRSGGRSHAPRRARLRAEAVGERAAAHHRPHPGRARARAAAAAAARSREPVAEARRPADAHRRSGDDAPGARADLAGRAVGGERARHRRERHRQRHRRAGDSCRVGAAPARGSSR